MAEDSQVNIGRASALAGITAAAIMAALSVAKTEENKWEGRRYVAYDDARPNYVLKSNDKLQGTLTVCTGHTDRSGNPPKIVIGKRYTDAECDAWLTADNKAAQLAVIRCTPRLFNNRWASGIAQSFAYNAGGSAYCKSEMAAKFKAGDIAGGCDQLLRFVYVDGQKSNGLRHRRADDVKTCMTELKK